MDTGYKEAGSRLPYFDLTSREQEVAELLCVSPPLTMKQIAERLEVEMTTLKTHLSRMIAKYGVENSRQLTVVLLQNKINNCQVVIMKRAGDDGISSAFVRKSSPDLAAEELRLDGITYVSPADAPAVVAKFLCNGNGYYKASSSSSSKPRSNWSEPPESN